MAMASDKAGKTLYGPLFRLCRAFWHLTHRRHPVYGLEHVNEQPAVFIGRHQDMYGPVEMMAWLPLEFRVWTLAKLMDRKQCYAHFSGYTFPERHRMPRSVAKLAAAIVAPLAQAFLRSMGAIPVHRGTKEILTTFRLSVQALKDGHNLLIMPERDYTDKGQDAGELYTGFVHLAQMYYRATGRALSFYPVYPSKEHSSIYVEQPIRFDPSAPFSAERERVVAALQAELSRHSVEREFCPVIAEDAQKMERS
jgi:1-acyl-sn-glycerol-3-phosphate acyltransferase